MHRPTVSCRQMFCFDPPKITLARLTENFTRKLSDVDRAWSNLPCEKVLVSNMRTQIISAFIMNHYDFIYQF